jgi:ComF family protein
MGWWNDLLSFIFPVQCLVCGKPLHAEGTVLCLPCEYRLPRTGYSGQPDNPVSRLFWGRAPVMEGTSLFKFEKGSAYQALLHELKYRGNRTVGTYLGKLLGNALKGTAYAGCDELIPVPLHLKRLRERGYNQSEIIAEGVSSILGIPVLGSVLTRTRFRTSQTSQGRYARYENVCLDFGLSLNAPDLHGKKLLLIDDVVTTGATLEACCKVLTDHYRCTVFTATICCA